MRRQQQTEMRYCNKEKPLHIDKKRRSRKKRPFKQNYIQGRNGQTGFALYQEIIQKFPIVTHPEYYYEQTKSAAERLIDKVRGLFGTDAFEKLKDEEVGLAALKTLLFSEIHYPKAIEKLKEINTKLPSDVTDFKDVKIENNALSGSQTVISLEEKFLGYSQREMAKTISMDNQALQLLQYQKEIMGEFDNHGWQHSLSMIARVEKLLFKTDIQLPDKYRKLLHLSIIFHDMGYAVVPEDKGNIHCFL